MVVGAAYAYLGTSPRTPVTLTSTTDLPVDAASSNGTAPAPVAGR